MKRALVTGGAGFVGRHLIPKLLSSGYVVTSVDPKETLGMSLEDYLRGYDEGHFDVVFHLAANIPDVHERTHAGHEAYADVALDYAMAEYVSKWPPREAFVWPTSCAVDFPGDPYAWIKLTGEKVFGALRGCRVVMLRPFSGYGEDQALSYPFPAIMERARRHEDPLVVWGSGTQVRDFIHVDDLTDAFVMAIDRFPEKRPIDIGTGVGTNFLKLAYMASQEAGYDPKIGALSDKAESSRRRVADTRAAESFGFKAKIGLEEGISRAMRWKT